MDYGSELQLILQCRFTDLSIQESWTVIHSSLWTTSIGDITNSLFLELGVV
jgi:hypothetical protein